MGVGTRAIWGTGKGDACPQPLESGRRVPELSGRAGAPWVWLSPSVDRGPERPTGALSPALLWVHFLEGKTTAQQQLSDRSLFSVSTRTPLQTANRTRGPHRTFLRNPDTRGDDGQAESASKPWINLFWNPRYLILLNTHLVLKVNRVHFKLTNHHQLCKIIILF